MKCLKRMYHDQGRDVVFYENAAAPQRRRHAAMEMVPLPRGLAADAPAFFKVCSVLDFLMVAFLSLLSSPVLVNVFCRLGRVSLFATDP